jgi:hypothetical protein
VICMIRDWVKRLLIKLTLGALILVALLNSVSTAEAADIAVNPASISVNFAFDQPKATAHYETQRTVTIQNTNPDKNATISGTIDAISGDISIMPNYNSFLLHGGESLTITVTIEALPSAAEGTQTVILKVGEEQVTVTVTITYYARIEVTPSSTIDFGRVSRTQKPSESVRFHELYGYKDVTVNLARSGGNNWVTVTGPTSIPVPKGGYSDDVTFQLTPEGTPVRNDYSWTFSLSTPTPHTTIIPSSIYLEAYMLLPAKLGTLSDEELNLRFDKPKGTVSRYERDVYIRVRNDGDETMRVSSSMTKSPSGGISLTFIESPSEVAGKSSENIRVRIIAPYDAPEGTYQGSVYVDAGAAGHGTTDITIVITWPVDFTITPTSIDFGSIELQERGYEQKSASITLTETYRYKPVRNLRFSKTGEYGNWLSEEMDFLEIPPGTSRTVTITIEPGLEAVPEEYAWTYGVGAYQIAAKRITVTAKIVPINITKMMEGLRSFRETPLYRAYPSSESIIAQGIELLEDVESSEISAEDWGKIPVLMTGTLSLLSSLNDGIVFTEAANYGSAVESLSAASVATATIESNSNLNNAAIAGYATAIAADAGRTTEEVLRDEAKLLELRGWTLKKAVEHALAIDDIGGLAEEENVLDAALSYQYAAVLYGLLNDKEKRLENVYESSLLMDEHDDLVSDATDLRIRAETSIATSKENDLARIGDWYLLVNPYNYDTCVASYETAESYLTEASEKYTVAGERFLYEQTAGDLDRLQSELRSVLLLFFIACSLYAIFFIYAITRIIRGTTAYLRDVYEREVGELLVSG